jgi:hypothetical protein
MGGLMPSPPVPWITAKRLRAHGVVLLVCLWSVYLWNMSSPGLVDRAGNLKGTDFLHFYTLGSLALEHRGGDLYNIQAQADMEAQRVPSAGGIRYLPLYPPQVSILFAPLARLPYAWALAVWLSLSAFSYFACCYAVWRVCPNLRGERLTVLILALGLPAFWHLIAWGQTSALALVCFTTAFLALRRRRDFLAGVALGCLIFKPQLGLAAAVAFLFAFRWKVVIGAALSATAELMAGEIYYGPGSLRTWITALGNVPQQWALLEPRIYQTYSLRGFWAMLIPLDSLSFALYAVSAILVCVIAVAAWRRAQLPSSLRYSSLLLATVLVAPHLTVYDLVVLAPVFLLIADWGAVQSGESRGYFGILLCLVYLLPLLGPLARFSHVQFAVPIMSGLLWKIWDQGRSAKELSTQGHRGSHGSAGI